VVYFSWNQAAIWSLLTIAAGAIIYHFYGRNQKGVAPA
jgi:hypothetical protein